MGQLNQLAKVIEKSWLKERTRYLTAKFGNFGKWTFSCEHEMFAIERATGLPATKERTALLIHSTGKKLNWALRGYYSESLPIYSHEISPGRYTQIKFDTEPNLVEIALTYFWDLEEFYVHLTQVMNALGEVASDMGLVLNCKMDVEETNIHLIRPTTPYFKDLSRFRREIQNERGVDLTFREENYGALIASTQVQIGGPFVNSLNEEDFITSLYSEEPNMLWYSHKQNSSLPRWTYYEKVYAGFPLVGFPNIPEFSFSGWFNNITRSPLFDKDLFPSIKYVSDLSIEQFHTLNILSRFKKIRDFQIIRPRYYGTLEFRADPAQDGINRIFFLLLLRLGLAIYHFNNSKKVDLKLAREHWWNQIHTSLFTQDRTLMDRASEGLSLLKPHNSSSLESIKGFYCDTG